MSEGGQDIPTADDIRRIVDGDDSTQRADLDKKKTEPASKTSKQAVIIALDTKLESPQTFRGVAGISSIDLKPRDKDKDNVEILATRWEDGVEKVAVIKVITEEIGGKEEKKFTFKRTPDGLQVESIIHSNPSVDPTTVDRIDAAPILGSILQEVGARGKSEAEQKELGLAFFSEQDAEDLAKLIEESDPIVYEDD